MKLHKRKLYKRKKQILAMVLIFAILFTMVPDTLITHAQAEQTQDQTHWYHATAKINASWGGHISGEITIKNISDQTRKGWQITLLWSNVVITSMWNGSFDQTDGTYLIRPTEYNQDLEAGASASIGFIAEGEDSLLNRLQSDTFFQETRASITTAEEREADYKTEITQAPAAESTEEPAGEPTNTPAPTEVSAPAPTSELEVPSIADPEPTLESSEEPTAPIITESGEESTVQPTTENPTSQPTLEPTIEPATEPTPDPAAVPTPEPTKEPVTEPNPTPQPTEEPAEDLYIYTDTTISQDITCRNLFLMGGQLRTGGHTITIQKEYFQNAGSCILQDTTITIGENARINAGTLKAEEHSSLQIGGNLLIDQAEEISLRDSTIQIQGDLCCATKTRFKQYSGSLRVDGNLTVSSGTFAQDDGVKTTIGGDVQITETGNLDLVGYGYGLQMNIGGDLLIQSSQQTILGEGKIAIRGNLIQTPQAAPDSLNTEDGFTLQFCGTAPQEISLAYPETSTLGTMDFRETPGIEVPDILRGRQIYDIAKIGKKASLQLELHDMELIQDETIPCAEVECTKTSIQGTGCSLTVRGNLTLRQGGAIRLNQASLTVENLTLDGIQSLESRQETITVQGDLHCATQTRFKQYSGSLCVDGNLTVSSGTFAQDDGVKTTIGGDVQVTETGNLNLVGYDYGLQMNIGGDLLIQSSQQTILGEGKIAIRGNLIQTPQAAPDSLNTEDGFTLQFCGTAPQEISLAYPETSTLGTMDFRETPGIEVPDILRGRQIYDIAKIGEKASLQLELHDMKLIQDETIPCAEVECTKTSIQGTGCSLTVRGNLTLRQGGAIRLNQASLTVENLTLDGIQCLESRQETITVQGDLHCATTNRFKQYSGSLRVDGNLTVSGGTFAQDDDVKTTIGGDVRVTETGNLYLVGYGYGLQMKIGGDFRISSSQQTILGEGEIWIKGDLVQTEDDQTENLILEDGISLLFNGTTRQTIDLPGVLEIPHLNLSQSTRVYLPQDYSGETLCGVEKIDFDGDTLYVDYNSVTTSGNGTIAGNLKCFGRLSIDDDTLHIQGNYTQYGRTTIGNPTERGSLVVDGDYIASKDVVEIRQGNLHVKGSVRIKKQASISMLGQETCHLRIDGDYTSACRNERFDTTTGGTLEIKGDLTQKETAYSLGFQLSETKVIFSGSQTQTVTTKHGAFGYAACIDMRESKTVDYGGNALCAGQIMGFSHIKNNGTQMVWDSKIILTEDDHYDGSLFLSGTLLDCNSHAFRISGNLEQNSGVVKLNDGSLHITDSYCMMGSSILQMTKQNDLLQVDGDFHTESSLSHGTMLRAGRMELGGNFNQSGQAASFGTSGDFVIAFLGDGTHLAHFDNIDYSQFANIDPAHADVKMDDEPLIFAGRLTYRICKGFLSGVQEGLGLNTLNSAAAAFLSAFGISIVVGSVLSGGIVAGMVSVLLSLIMTLASFQMVAEAAGGIYSTATGSGTSYDKAEDFAHDTALLMLGLLFLKGSVVSMQNSVTACKSAAQELVGRISRIRSSEVLAEAGKAIGNFDDFLTLLKEYLEEDALEYIRGALDGDAEDLTQLKKIAKIFEEGKGKIGRKLSKAEAEAGMEAFWGEGGEASALAAIERSSKWSIKADLGNKLDYLFGKASGSKHNVVRSKSMQAELRKIGINDTPSDREYVSNHFYDVINDSSNISHVEHRSYVVEELPDKPVLEYVATTRESLLMGPKGAVKLETIWDNNKLLTVIFKGGE